MKEVTKDWYDGLMYATKEISRVIQKEGYEPNPPCKVCGSRHVVKFGHKKGIQNWLCRDCGHKFVDNKALPGMKVPTDTIGSAVGMFYEGMSLNAIRRQTQQRDNIYPSDSTVYGWIQRYTKQAIQTANAQKPQVGDVWVADETVIKVNGKNTWFWDVIDVKTRFLLASRVSATRGARDAYALMMEASQRAGKTPKVVVTDQLLSYLDGIELAFGGDTKHIRAKTLTSEPAKSLIERFHGSLKDRTKVMRGLKSRESADLILDGWLVHYNFFRPHETLGDSTPAQKAGLKFEYKNWLDVVKASPRHIPTISWPEPRLELHHPPIKLRSATATLGHFAGHKVRNASPSPRMPSSKSRITNAIYGRSDMMSRHSIGKGSKIIARSRRGRGMIL
jgi:transposase-like protein